MVDQAIKTGEKGYPFYKSALDARKESVERVLSQTIEKLKLSMLLPRFFDEYGEVYKRLKDTKYVFYAKDLRAYCKQHETTLASKKANYRDQDLLRVIDQLQNQHEILKYFPDWLKEINTAQCAAIAELAILKDIAKQRFQMQAKTQAEDERNLHVIFAENVKVRRGLQTMARLLQKNRNSLRWRIAARESIFLEMESEVSLQNKKFEKVLEDAQKQAYKRVNPRQYKQRELDAEEELRQAEVNFEKTIALNLKNEATARAERNKYLLQYQALLKKYDQVMLDKFRERMALEEQAAELQAEHNQFMKVYQRAEKVYDDIIRAKEVEAERQRWKKINAFIKNRSARAIQRWYRDHLRETAPHLVKQDSKTKKKGKGKKKK